MIDDNWIHLCRNTCCKNCNRWGPWSFSMIINSCNFEVVCAWRNSWANSGSCRGHCCNKVLCCSKHLVDSVVPNCWKSRVGVSCHLTPWKSDCCTDRRVSYYIQRTNCWRCLGNNYRCWFKRFWSKSFWISCLDFSFKCLSSSITKSRDEACHWYDTSCLRNDSWRWTITKRYMLFIISSSSIKKQKFVTTNWLSTSVCRNNPRNNYVSSTLREQRRIHLTRNKGWNDWLNCRSRSFPMNILSCNLYQVSCSLSQSWDSRSKVSWSSNFVREWSSWSTVMINVVLLNSWESSLNVRTHFRPRNIERGWTQTLNENVWWERGWFSLSFDRLRIDIWVKWLSLAIISSSFCVNVITCNIAKSVDKDRHLNITIRVRQNCCICCITLSDSLILVCSHIQDKYFISFRSQISIEVCIC